MEDELKKKRSKNASASVSDGRSLREEQQYSPPSYSNAKKRRRVQDEQMKNGIDE